MTIHAPDPDLYRPNVGLALFSKAGYVFIGRRINGRGAFQWQMPQGGVDKGESPRDAALRELWEETGVLSRLVKIEAETKDWIPYDLPHDLVGKLWKGRYRGQEQKWFLMRFKGTDDQVDIATEHQEFSRWKWMAPDQLINNIVPFKRHVYERVLTAFKDHL